MKLQYSLMKLDERLNDSVLQNFFKNPVLQKSVKFLGAVNRTCWKHRVNNLGDSQPTYYSLMGEFISPQWR